MRVARALTSAALVFFVLGTTDVVWAHTGFDPTSVKAGEVANLTLTVANEQSDAGTVKIELIFPEGQPLTVVAVPPADDWTATVQGGSVGSDATGIVWERAGGSPAEDPAVTMQLGPIPSGVEQLQFKLLQTYSNGEIDRWIQDWPAGQPEPEQPGPVLNVEANASASTVTPTSSPPTTASPAPTAAPTTAAVTTGADDDDSNTGLFITLAIIVLVVGALATAWAVRRRRTRRV